MSTQARKVTPPKGPAQPAPPKRLARKTATGVVAERTAAKRVVAKRIAAKRSVAGRTAEMSVASKVARRERRAAMMAKLSLTNFVGIYDSRPVERIELAKLGVPAGQVSDVARTFGTSKEWVVSVLGLPRSTVDRKVRTHAPLSAEHSERLVGLSKLVGQVQVLLQQSGDPKGFDAAKWVGQWLEQPSPALDGKRPAEYMDTNEGQHLVSGLIAKMQSGAYS